MEVNVALVYLRIYVTDTGKNVWYKQTAAPLFEGFG